jgi:expansin (peptidoglycan-binding protein)
VKLKHNNMKLNIYKALILFVVLVLVIDVAVASPIPKKKSTKKKKKPTSNKSTSTGGGPLHTGGDGTWFNPGLGACGFTDNDNSNIVALNAPDFDPSTPNVNPNRNTLCGKQIKIGFGGKSVVAIVHDRCPECLTGSVDMSPAVFQQLAPLSVGRLHGITYQILN